MRWPSRLPNAACCLLFFHRWGRHLGRAFAPIDVPHSGPSPICRTPGRPRGAHFGGEPLAPHASQPRPRKTITYRIRTAVILSAAKNLPSCAGPRRSFATLRMTSIAVTNCLPNPYLLTTYHSSKKRNRRRGEMATVPGERHFQLDHQEAHGGAWIPSRSSSSSWMMIRGVTIIIRLCVSRPRPTFLKSRFR